MYFNDHSPPHFHVYFSGRQARIDIESLEVTGGWLPPRALGLVREWARMYRAELIENWTAARRGEPLARIPGLE